MTIVFIEATGMFLALGAMTGRPVGADDVKRGLRADAIGTIIGAIFNTFPYVSYSQNIGLVGVTGVYSPVGLRRRRRDYVDPRTAAETGVSSSPRCRNACSAAPASSCSEWWPRTGIKILSTVDFARERP